MKLKPNLGEGGIKGLAAQHIEKFVLGVALVLVALFIYSSATQEGLQSSKRPDDLKRQGENALRTISQDNWSQLAPERENMWEDFPKRTEEARAKIIESDYALPHPWEKPIIPPRTKRRDPKLFPPIETTAVAVVGAVAVKSAKPVDPFSGDKAAVAKAVEPKKPPKRKRPTRRSPAAGYEEYSAGGLEDYAEAMAEESSPEDYLGAEMYSGASGMTAGGTLEGARKIGPVYRELYITGNGWTPGAGMGAQSMSGGGSKVVAKSYAVVGVTSLVPYEKQWEEYEKALAEATGYSPAQDIPRYLYFMAERAEVPSDADPDAELKWERISDSSVAMRDSMLYADFPKEIADEAYTLPGVLTMPIPPILLQPFDEMALHGKIPRRKPRMPTTMAAQPARKDMPTDFNEPVSTDPEGLLEIPKIGPGGAGGAAYPGPMEMYGAEESYSDEGAEYGTSPYGPMGTSPGMNQQPMVKHKMVRFFDFRAEVGKSYKYRVRVVLEDPNRPRDPKADPNKRILADDVVQRLKEVEASDAEYTKSTGKRRRTYYVKTDWSEPSNVVTIQPPGGIIAGKVEPARTTRVSSDGPEVELGEDKGEVVTVVWDKSRAVEVPAGREVYRGSVLDFEQDADVLHPLTHQLKTIEKFRFETGALVVDMTGGELLFQDKKKENELHAPSEVAVVDGDGNFVVRDETEDVEDYRRVLFIEETPPGMSSPSMGTPYGGGEEYMSDDPLGGADFYGGGDF